MYPINDPKPWRHKADELRGAADSTKSGVARRAFLRIAERYDRMADVI